MLYYWRIDYSRPFQKSKYSRKEFKDDRKIFEEDLYDYYNYFYDDSDWGDDWGDSWKDPDYDYVPGTSIVDLDSVGGKERLRNIKIEKLFSQESINNSIENLLKHSEK